MHLFIKSSASKLFRILQHSHHFARYSSTSSSMALTELQSSKCFEGYQKVFSHRSQELACDMKFGVYLPPNASENNKVPVLYFLSGLTCTEENFMKKAGAQKYAALYGICIVNPDTSPRNVDIPGQDDDDGLGYGAGFYVDATESPWSKHYRMYSYVTKELIKLVEDNLPVIPGKRSVSGHSMGGHGALICALKNPGLYCSISALEPVSNPTQIPLGQRAFKEYLGEDKEAWRKYDATELALSYSGPPIEFFIDQGTGDSFYREKHLLPENLVEAASKNDRIQCNLKWREGYDHSHFYVATVIEEHIQYHSKFLKS